MATNQVPKFKLSKGRIAVYTSDHKLLDSRIYYTQDGMKRIMAVWLDEYKPGDYIQVRPYTNEDKKVHRLDIIKDEVRGKQKRPPAVYDNVKSLY